MPALQRHDLVDSNVPVEEGQTSANLIQQLRRLPVPGGWLHLVQCQQ